MRFGDARGSYELVSLPGSPQVAVSIHSFIFPHRRGHGDGDKMHKDRLAKLKELGYNYVICTVRADNVAENKILTKNGWTQLVPFISSATDHTIVMYGRKIQ